MCIRDSLDAGLWIGGAVGISAEVTAPLHHEDPQPPPGRALLRHGEAEQPGADDEEVGTHTRSFASG